MKILIVGFGSIAKKHLWALRELRSNIEVYALRSSTNAPPINDVISIYQISEVPGDIDFAIVSNPTSTHAGTILIVSQLNCPIFIEKPVFHELNEGSKVLAQQLKTIGIKTYVGCNLRFHPLMKKFRDIVNQTSSLVQEVNVYCGSYLPDWRPGVDYQQSYSAKRSMGGGVDLDLIHELDYISWFFGVPHKAYALKKSDSSIEIQAPDAAYYVLQYNKFVANVSLNYFRKLAKRTFEVVLEDQILLLDLVNHKIFKNGEVIHVGNKDDMMASYLHQMEYFIQCIEGNGVIENDISNAIKVLEICLIDELS